MMLNRRAFCGALAAAVSMSTSARAEPVERIELPLPSGRSVPLGLWGAVGTVPRAAVLFSHGLGGYPEGYGLLFDALRRAGYLVAAPLHVDSLQHPLHAHYELPQTFGERVADLHAACGYLSVRHGQLPLAAVGHSYGSLFSWCLGGGLAELGPFRVPSVKAVLAFSSPGVLPMMDRQRSLASLAVPSFTVTGNQDLVPGFATDWHDHLLAFEQSTRPRGALVLEGGGHELVADATALAKVLPWALDFLDAELMGQPAAHERLVQAAALPGLSVQWRS